VVEQGSVNLLFDGHLDDFILLNHLFGIQSYHHTGFLLGKGVHVGNRDLEPIVIRQKGFIQEQEHLELLILFDKANLLGLDVWNGLRDQGRLVESDFNVFQDGRDR